MSNHFREALEGILKEGLNPDMALEDFEKALNKALHKRYEEVCRMFCELVVSMEGPFEGLDLFNELSAQRLDDSFRYFHMGMHRFRYAPISCEHYLIPGGYDMDYANKKLALRCLGDYRHLLDVVSDKDWKTMVVGQYQGLEIMIGFANKSNKWMISIGTGSDMVRDIIHQMAEDRDLIL